MYVSVEIQSSTFPLGHETEGIKVDQDFRGWGRVQFPSHIPPPEMREI